eukprot:scaffold266512_cov17-Prasinocladus_malaysianus.AAC.1
MLLRCFVSSPRLLLSRCCPDVRYDAVDDGRSMVLVPVIQPKMTSCIIALVWCGTSNSDEVFRIGMSTGTCTWIATIAQ